MGVQILFLTMATEVLLYISLEPDGPGQTKRDVNAQEVDSTSG